MNASTPPALPGLRPRGPGHGFVFYGDSCSGVPGAPHEESHARVNAVVARLDPPPDFIVFPGDEVIGLVADEAALRAQWRHWAEREMAWLDRARTPLYHATGNHTTYSPMSERVFREATAHMPRNGAPGQEGLSCHLRRGDLALIFVHTLAAELGGEGHVETDWLEEVLGSHADARWRLVVGHHPAFAVNGYRGTGQRTIRDEHVGRFWDLLVAHRVTAYLCSHILAFDVQCRRGVLQVCSAGAGTAHRMPEGEEYLHAVQVALDADGLRLEVLDDTGTVREALAWPPPEPAGFAPLGGREAGISWVPLVLRVTGRPAPAGTAVAQTLACGALPGSREAPVWIGLAGAGQQLTVMLQPVAGRSPHQWLGPDLVGAGELALELMLHPGMGPGGLLWRPTGTEAWSTLEGSSAWGVERVTGPLAWIAGRDAEGARPFLGAGLEVVAA